MESEKFLVSSTNAFVELINKSGNYVLLSGLESINSSSLLLSTFKTEFFSFRILVSCCGAEHSSLQSKLCEGNGLWF